MPQSQCTNLELSQELKKLGYPQESLFKWHCKLDEKLKQATPYEIIYYPEEAHRGTMIAAPTVAELGNKLYEVFSKHGYDLLYKAYGECFDFKGTQRIGDIGIINLMRKPDMAAKMLIYLLKNNLIELK